MCYFLCLWGVVVCGQFISKKMAQRTTRASRGEHTAGIIHTNESIQSSIFSAQKNIKV